MTKDHCREGLCPWESSLEKMMLTISIPAVFLGNPEDLAFAESTCLVYLCQVALERPLPEIPLEMMLVA